jgi:PKD repeat protein
MKKFGFRMFKIAGLLIAASVIISSCKKEDPIPEDPIASFQISVDENDYLKVTFTNYSQHATSYAWDFGDGMTC